MLRERLLDRCVSLPAVQFCKMPIPQGCSAVTGQEAWSSSVKEELTSHVFAAAAVYVYEPVCVLCVDPGGSMTMSPSVDHMVVTVLINRPAPSSDKQTNQ